LVKLHIWVFVQTQSLSLNLIDYVMSLLLVG